MDTVEKAPVASQKKAANTAKQILRKLSAASTGASPARAGRWGGLALFVLLPLLLVSGYYLFWVSDRYVSATQLIVKDNSSGQGMSSTLGFLVPGMGSDNQDAFLVVNYIQSLDMALFLDQELGLAAYFKSDKYDVFSRLAADASQEDYLEYYRAHLAVVHDETTGIISIEMQAFEPEFAQLLVETVIRKSEDFVNAISNQLADKQVSFVRSELELAQGKLRTSKQKILDFQNRNQVVSPEETRKMAERWGGDAKIVVIENVESASQHVLAGDIVSPGTTQEAADIITKWIEGLGL